MNTGSVATRRRGVSPWAILSMLLAFGLCPVITVLAIPLGFLGLRDVRRSGRLGRTPAWVGIILGFLVTPLSTWGMVWWNDVVRDPMIHGPRDAIVAGQHGDIQAFSEAFIPPPHPVEGGSARFLDALRSQWGLLADVEQDDSREALYSDDGWAVRIPYRFRFEGGTVSGEAEFVLVQRTDSGSQFVHRFAWVLVGAGTSDEPVLGWPPVAAEVQREPLPPRKPAAADVIKGDVDSE